MFGQHKSKWLCLFAAVLAIAGGRAQAPTTPAQDGFCFYASAVTLPVGKFLLMRRKNEIAALRITRITPDTQTAPRGSEWLGTVAYESYYIDGTGTLSNSLRTSAELHFGRYKGVGFHYSWQSGRHDAQVGPWKFAFFPPNGMYMTSVNFWNGINHDSGIEFAATTAADIASVSPTDPQLTWLRYDNNGNTPCPVATPQTPR